MPDAEPAGNERWIVAVVLDEAVEGRISDVQQDDVDVLDEGGIVVNVQDDVDEQCVEAAEGGSSTSSMSTSSRTIPLVWGS